MSKQWIGFGRRDCSIPAGPRRSGIAGGLVALLAACALSACATDAPPPFAAMAAPQQPESEIRVRIQAAPELVIAGERLDALLLERFYGNHEFEPVWATRQAEADALTAAVLRAGDQGLNPDLFHARLLRRGTSLSPLDRELLLSDAFLSYADALARGAVPVEHRRDDQVLAPDPIDVAAVLDEAIESPDPGAAIEALAPATPTYLALRDILQKLRTGGAVTGRAAASRQRVIETVAVNLERQRWLPRSLPADRAWVNVADERLVLYRADQPVFTTRVVVGEDVRQNQSPEFRATLDASLFNPPWVIPKDIVSNEILPKISRDPDYLAKNHMILLAGGEAEQLPGPDAGLGLIMFDMPNKFDVYLHDTPDRYIFARDNRRLSHGCIRVQDPRGFAALLMDQPIDTINQGIAQGSVTGTTTRHELPTPVPVFVVYQTAFVDTDGTLQFRPDFYSRDAEIWQRLQHRNQAPPRTGQVQADNRTGAPATPTL